METNENPELKKAPQDSNSLEIKSSDSTEPKPENEVGKEKKEIELMNKQIPPEETKGQLDAIIDNYSPKGVSPKDEIHADENPNASAAIVQDDSMQRDTMDTHSITTDTHSITTSPALDANVPLQSIAKNTDFTPGESFDVKSIAASVHSGNHGGRDSIEVQPKPILNPPIFKGSPEMAQISLLFYGLDTKLYHSGYVYKLNALGANGKPLFKNASAKTIAENGGYWTKWWMEVIGPILYLWRVPDELASFGYTASLSLEQIIKNELDPPLEVMETIKKVQEGPLKINFADSAAEIFPADHELFLEDNPLPPNPYSSYFSLTTASSNLYVFASASIIQVNNWISSIRLAKFELKRLNQLFTQRLMGNTERLLVWKQLGLEPFSSASFRGDVTYEGPLQVRLPYSIVWKEMYAIITSKYGPDALYSGRNSFFGKKDTRETDLSKRGTILFYESKKDAQKGRLPIFIMTEVQNIYAIWPSNAQENQVNDVCLAKIEGLFELPELPLDTKQTQRTFASFSSGFPQIKKFEGVESLISGVDSRPVPADLLIITPNTKNLSDWLVATMTSFSLESKSSLLEDEAIEISKTIGNFTDVPVDPSWPGLLYLSLKEIAGIAMPPCSMAETYIMFDHYLLQKMMRMKSGQINSWNQNVSKGEWERGLNDRKEMEHKLKQLFDWVDKVVAGLLVVGVEVKKPPPAVLVSAMASLVVWLGPVLSSLVGAGSPTKSLLSTKSSAVGSENSKSINEDQSGKSVSIKSSSGSEGSVSEEERSSEGSQSEELEEDRELDVTPLSESLKSASQSGKSGTDVSLESSEEEDSEEISEDESEKNYNVYAPNSLLSKKAEPQNITEKPIGGGPLLGAVQGPKDKPKLQAGLLGEIEKSKGKKLDHRTSMMNHRILMGTVGKNGLLGLDPNITQKLITVLFHMQTKLENPLERSDPSIFDSLLADVGQMQLLLTSQNGLNNKRSSFSQEANRRASNPFAIPSLTWKQTSSRTSDSGSISGQFRGTKPVNFESSSMGSSEKEETSSEEVSVNKSGTESEETDLSSSDEDDESFDDEVPLGTVSKQPLFHPASKTSTIGIGLTATGLGHQDDDEDEDSNRPLSFIQKPSVKFKSPTTGVNQRLSHQQFNTKPASQQVYRPSSFQTFQNRTSFVPNNLMKTGISSTAPSQKLVRPLSQGPIATAPEVERPTTSIRQAPAFSGDSSEGSVSEESD